MAVDVLQSVAPEWIHCPFAVQPAQQDITTLMFACRPLPGWPKLSGPLARAEGWESLTFYTDGTCAHPTVPAARHAAWAWLHGRRTVCPLPAS